MEDCSVRTLSCVRNLDGAIFLAVWNFVKPGEGVLKPLEEKRMNTSIQ